MNNGAAGIASSLETSIGVRFANNPAVAAGPPRRGAVLAAMVAVSADPSTFGTLSCDRRQVGMPRSREYGGRSQPPDKPDGRAAALEGSAAPQGSFGPGLNVAGS